MSKQIGAMLRLEAGLLCPAVRVVSLYMVGRNSLHSEKEFFCCNRLLASRLLLRWRMFHVHRLFSPTKPHVQTLHLFSEPIFRISTCRFAVFLFSSLCV